MVAFSDPGDRLTDRVPPIDGATVVNVYDRNARRFWGLLAEPITAHMLRRDSPRACTGSIPEKA